MEDSNQQSLDHFAPISSTVNLLDAVDRTAELHNLPEKTLAQKDEKVIPANPSAIKSAMTVVSVNVKDQSVTSEIGAPLKIIPPPNSYTPQEQGYYYGGYENGSGQWDDYSNYGMYNDNASIYYPGYGFDSQVALGQFSPLPSPISPFLIDGQLFFPHQIPVSPSYYSSNISSKLPASQSEMARSGSSSQENLIDSGFFGPGSAYYLPFGNFGAGDLPVSSSMGVYNFPGDYGSSESLSSLSSSYDTSRVISPLTSGTMYPPPIGILGSYEQTVAQAPFRSLGFSSNSSARQLPQRGSYQSFVGSNSIRNRVITDKVARRERDRDFASHSADTLGSSNDWNRGPRASKLKTQSSLVDNPLFATKDSKSTSGLYVHHLDSNDFITDYVRAKFFVIKSFSEDNIHKSIKYSIWASTPLGNRKLDAAFRDSREMDGICPVFLFFSVNASGQFCGVAEMVGAVNFDKDADYWQQDRWSGQFPVKWHIIKDVPNSRFRHILVENNDNKPVTHSRDSQEVKLEQGIEMLKIFKNHEADTSLLDDFKFYDEREKSISERKAKQRAAAVGITAATLTAESIVDELSNNLVDTLHIDAGKKFSEKK